MTSVVNTKFALKPVVAALALATAAGAAYAAPTPNQMPGAGQFMASSLAGAVQVNGGGSLVIGNTFVVGSGTYYLSLPVSMAASVVGSGVYYDSSVPNIYPLVAVNTASSTTVTMYQTDVVNTALTHAVPVTPATNDAYYLTVVGRTS